MTNVRGAPSRPVPEPEKPRAKGGQRFSWAFPVTQSGANYQRLIESSGGKKEKKEKGKNERAPRGVGVDRASPPSWESRDILLVDFALRRPVLDLIQSFRKFEGVVNGEREGRKMELTVLMVE